MADHDHHDHNQVELQEASPRLGRVMGVGQEPEEEVEDFIFTIIVKIITKIIFTIITKIIFTIIILIARHERS